MEKHYPIKYSYPNGANITYHITNIYKRFFSTMSLIYNYFKIHGLDINDIYDRYKVPTMYRSSNVINMRLSDMKISTNYLYNIIKTLPEEEYVKLPRGDKCLVMELVDIVELYEAFMTGFANLTNLDCNYYYITFETNKNKYYIETRPCQNKKITENQETNKYTEYDMIFM